MIGVSGSIRRKACLAALRRAAFASPQGDCQGRHSLQSMAGPPEPFGQTAQARASSVANVGRGSLRGAELARKEQTTVPADDTVYRVSEEIA